MIELLAWCHRNGVIDTSTRLSLHPGSSDLSEFELSSLLGSLQQVAPLPLAPVSEEALLHAAEPAETLLLVNVGVDPLKAHSQLNVHLTTGRTDSLGYSGVRENLVLTLDQVSLNSWNELMVSRYEGPNALLDCLRDYLNALPADGRRPRLEVRCFCRNRAQAIAQRVEELFRDTLTSLAGAANSRYLLQVQQHYHVLELLPGQVSHAALHDLPSLLEHLGEEQPSYSPLHLDRYALEGEDLALILPLGRPDCIQVFYRIDGAQAELTVLDEHNALWRQRLPYRDEQSLLTPLQRFLQSVLYRRNALLPLDSPLPPAAWISSITRCCRPHRSVPGTWSAVHRHRPRPPTPSTTYRPSSNPPTVAGCMSPCTATTASSPNWSTAPSCSPRWRGTSSTSAAAPSATPATSPTLICRAFSATARRRPSTICAIRPSWKARSTAPCKTPERQRTAR